MNSRNLPTPLDDDVDASSSELLARVRALAPEIDAEAAEAERNGVLTVRCVDLMKEAGLFWLYLPREFGGLNVRPWTAIQIIEELSRAHGSAGWVMMANALSTGLAFTNCGESGVDTLFKKNRAILCGCTVPRGIAKVVEGGYLGSGRYQFASGAEHATWFLAGMTIFENGQQRRSPDGTPEICVCIVPRDNVELRGNWDVVGMVGTGSFDFEAKEQFIPYDMSMPRVAPVPRRQGTMFDLGSRGMVFLTHAAFPLGLMKRSLEEIADIAATKTRPGYAGTVSADPVFRREFAMKEAQYQAARAYIRVAFEDAFHAIRSGEKITDSQQKGFQQCALHSHQIGIEVVQFCNSWGGSQALRNPSVLARCLRDMSVATQHIYVDQANFTDAGAVLTEAYCNHNAPAKKDINAVSTTSGPAVPHRQQRLKNG